MTRTQTEQRQLPLYDTLISRAPGSPSWESRFSIGAVLSEIPQPNAATAGHVHRKPTPIPSPGTNYRDSAPNDPIDIFGTSLSPPAQTSGSRIPLPQKRAGNKPACQALHCPKLRQTIGDSESLKKQLASLGILSSSSRRHAARTDYPLECDTPHVDDAEGLDLERKIRSALRRRKPIPSFDSPSHKSVRFDPAVIALGSEKPMVKPVPAIERSQRPPKRTLRNEVSGRHVEKEPNLEEHLQTMLTLKKHERVQVQEFLGLLSKFDDARPAVNSAPRSTRSLNPRAPEFDGSSCSSNTSNNVDHGHIGWAMLPFQQNQTGPNLPLEWRQTTQPINLLTAPIAPVLPRPVPYRRPVPIVLPAPITDGGHGREAKVDVVGPVCGRAILENFRVDFPLTGRRKPAPLPDHKRRLASNIQQRLECLIMEERERKGLANMAQEGKGNENSILQRSET